MKNIKLIVADWEKVVSPKRDENEERSQEKGVDWKNICGCCGKEIKDTTKAKSLHLIEGAGYWTEYKDTINECHGADMGWFYVGSDCYNKFKKNSYEIELQNDDE